MEVYGKIVVQEAFRQKTENRKSGQFLKLLLATALSQL
jgi:hypothetical protein